MDKTRVNGTRAEEAQGDEETLEKGDEHDGPDEEKRRRRRLVEFLRELVKVEGRTKAADVLGVNYRTLVKAEESGELTGRMRDALERLLLSMGGPAEPNQDGRGDQSERLDWLEGEVRALVKELRGSLEEIRAAVAEIAEGNGRAQTQHEEGAGRSETRTSPPVAGLRPKKPVTERRLDPEVVTEGPADDDPEVYGDAWPLVEEWRSLRADHPHRGRSVSWLTTEERLLVLELATLEEHGLTLPPEKQPLRGFGRKGQTSWRWKALYDTRVALRKRKLLRWVRRILTLGLWWK